MNVFRKKKKRFSICLILVLIAAFGLMGCMSGSKGESKQPAETIRENTESDMDTSDVSVEDASGSGDDGPEGSQPAEEGSTADDAEAGLRIGGVLIEEKIHQMSVEEKVAQLFIISPEQLTGVETAVQAGNTTKACLKRYPVGGLIYFKQNLKNPDQTSAMLQNTMEYSREISGIPLFLSIDEEGGKVTRIADNEGFPVPNVGPMSEVTDTEQAREIGVTIGSYLSEYGFNVDFAPVADVLSNPENTVVKTRCFGEDADLAADLVAAELEGFRDTGVLTCVKHFPGHGGTAADTHNGYAYINDSLEELYESDLIPFVRAMEEDVPFIMVGHISVPGVIGDDTPASMSSVIMTDLLRDELGYENIIITDAMNMGAITESYGSSKAAVQAFLAGADMILYPASFSESYQGILDSVKNGTITEERLDESVRRILTIKASLYDSVQE